jgi:hypothetical protein
VITGTLIIMAGMEAGSRSQGGRYLVAIAGLVVLALVDRGLERIVIRRAPFTLGWTTDPERRYALVSLLLWIGAAVILLGGAWLMP